MSDIEGSSRLIGAIEMESLMGQAWTYLLLGRPDDAERRAEVLELG
jgi:hypothetical protein